MKNYAIINSNYKPGKWVYDRAVSLNKKSKIIVYGAGSVGDCYYHDVIKRANVIKWVDRSCDTLKKEVPLYHPEKIRTESEYDYIVIAIVDESIQNAVATDLQKMGVADEKIVKLKGFFHTDEMNIYQSTYNHSSLHTWSDAHDEIVMDGPYVTTSMVCN